MKAWEFNLGRRNEKQDDGRDGFRSFEGTKESGKEANQTNEGEII